MGKMAHNKYPTNAPVLHNLMLHMASKQPLSKKDEKAALDYGRQAVEAGPYNPQIALDYAALLRKSGNEAGSQSLLREYLAKIDKLRNDKMVLEREAQHAKKQLREALGDQYDDDERGTAHDEF